MQNKKKNSKEIIKYLNDGYIVFNDVIPQHLLESFNLEIDKIVNYSSKKKTFEELFKTNSRERIYYLLQNLNSIRKITDFIEIFLEKKNIFLNLKFNCKSITNGLIISLPNEERTLNPLHQDIYAYRSTNFIKLWIPMTTVNTFYGSMQMFKYSHKLGFIKPKYINNKSTYPEIDKNIIKKFPGEIFDLVPGSFVLFNPLTIHQSINNISKNVRFTIGIDIQDVKFYDNEVLLRKMNTIKRERFNRRLKNKKITSVR